MAFDAQAFVDEFLEGNRDVPITPNWRVVEVMSDRLRSGVDIVLEDDEGRRLTVIAERRVEGAECLTTTRHFAMSYYGAPELTPLESTATRALTEWIFRTGAAGRHRCASGRRGAGAPGSRPAPSSTRRDNSNPN